MQCWATETACSLLGHVIATSEYFLKVFAYYLKPKFFTGSSPPSKVDLSITRQYIHTN